MTHQIRCGPIETRFVLSIGHASMLLYSLLHLTGVKAVSKDYETLGEPSVPLDALKSFRQLDSRCPGHPEYRWTSGVETTTGPLGQGVATSLGMAIARQWLAARYHRPGFEDLFDFNVYALCGDGCMMEGISSEAASLAGHLRLSNLCWIYDNNHITIEGATALAFSEGVATRFIGYGRNVTRVGDANDLEMLARALRTFQTTKDRPTLIVVDSHIGYGAPHKQDTSGAHGEPLGEEEARLAKRNYGWPEDKPSSCRTASMITSATKWRLEGGNCAMPGLRELLSIASNTRRQQTSCTECNIANCPRLGIETCRNFRRIRKDWQHVNHRQRC